MVVAESALGAAAPPLVVEPAAEHDWRPKALASGGCPIDRSDRFAGAKASLVRSRRAMAYLEPGAETGGVKDVVAGQLLRRRLHLLATDYAHVVARAKLFLSRVGISAKQYNIYAYYFYYAILETALHFHII